MRTALTLALALFLLGCQEDECNCDAADKGAPAKDQVPADTVASKDTKATPDTGGGASLSAALVQVMKGRRSTNGHASLGASFSSKPLTKADVMALAWAAQGVTAPGKNTGRATAKGLRTTPSAGALYPIEIYIAADKVTGLSPGLYWYRPEQDKLQATAKTGALAATIAGVALNQQCLKQAAAIVIIAAVGSRTAAKYGSKASDFVWMEVGHSSQNILLMATARGLAHRPVGSLNLTQTATALGLPSGTVPTFLIPVGHKP